MERKPFKTLFAIYIIGTLVAGCGHIPTDTHQTASATHRLGPEGRSTEAEIRQLIVGAWTVGDGSDGCWYPTLVIDEDHNLTGVQSNGTEEVIGTWEIDRTLLRVTPTPARLVKARKSGSPLNEWDYYPVIYVVPDELVMTPGISTAGRWRYERLSARGTLNRAKTYFSIIMNLDGGQFAEAEALFKTLPSNYGWGGIFYGEIAEHFQDHEYVQARDRCLEDIHYWIIDTAADWQDPYLTMLLDKPDRLSFLQKLSAYCRKFPSRTESGQKSEALVADILQKADERKRSPK